jgi:hypothetical protein
VVKHSTAVLVVEVECNTSKLKCNANSFKDVVCTSNKMLPLITQYRYWLMLFREIIHVYCVDHTEHTNTFCGQTSELIKLN